MLQKQFGYCHASTGLLTILSATVRVVTLWGGLG